MAACLVFTFALGVAKHPFRSRPHLRQRNAFQSLLHSEQQHAHFENLMMPPGDDGVKDYSGQTAIPAKTVVSQYSIIVQKVIYMDKALAMAATNNAPTPKAISA